MGEIAKRRKKFMAVQKKRRDNADYHSVTESPGEGDRARIPAREGGHSRN